MSNYDESRSRKEARLVFWSHVLSHVSAAAPSHFVGLAGDIAGDIGVLTAHGVDPLQITLYDEAPSAIKSAKWRYPDVPDTTIVLGSVQTVIKKLKRVDAVFLDFGDTIDQPLLEVVKKVAVSPNIQIGAYLGVAVTVGTENKKKIFEKVQEEIDKKVHWSMQDAHAFYTLPQAPYLSRALLLAKTVHALKIPKGKFVLERMWTYESRETGTGAHALMCSFKKVNVAKVDEPFKQLLLARYHPNFRLPGKESASRYLGKLTCLILEQGNNPKALLNITHGTQAAYSRLGKNNWYA